MKSRDLVEGPQPFDIESQDHPPMIPNPVSGSSLEGLTTLLQAHLSWDKAASSACSENRVAWRLGREYCD